MAFLIYLGKHLENNNQNYIIIETIIIKVVDSLPQVDLSFMEQGADVILNEILNLVVIVILTMFVLLVIFRVTRMPYFLRKFILLVVTIGVLVLSIVKIYFPNIVTQLGLI